MKWSEVIRKLKKKCKYTEGEKSRHRTIYNCPCPNKDHPVGVENHPNQEAYPHDFKKKLGPHLKDFGKI